MKNLKCKLNIHKFDGWEDSPRNPYKMWRVCLQCNRVEFKEYSEHSGKLHLIESANSFREFLQNHPELFEPFSDEFRGYLFKKFLK